MGSLESWKRGGQTLLRSTSSSSTASSCKPFFHKPRSKIARLLLFERVDYAQWLLTAVAFFLVIILFQAFLPSSSSSSSSSTSSSIRSRFGLVGELDFGEGIRFHPSTLLRKFKIESNSTTIGGRALMRVPLLRSRIALVFPDLHADATQLQMITLALVLKDIGYNLEVLAMEDGAARAVWISEGFPVRMVTYDRKKQIVVVDWLKYNGVIVSSIEAKPVLSSLSREPFKYVPVIWAVHEKSLASRLEQYKATNKSQLLSDWKESFARATVVTFPNHLFPVLYSALDVGNYYVIPGYPAAAWKAASNIISYNNHDERRERGYDLEDFIIAIVGSQFSYSGQLLEHALVLQAIVPLLQIFPSSQLKVAILNGNTSSPYTLASKAIEVKFGFPSDSIDHIDFDGDTANLLGIADIVLYESFLEEQSFPSVLVEAMALGKLIIAPDIAIIRKHISDKANGYLFPKENVGILTQILTQMISNGKMSSAAENVAGDAKTVAKNFLVSESIEAYTFLLRNILKFPSEFSIPRSVDEIPSELKRDWKWDLFKNISDAKYVERHSIVDSLEEQWTSSQDESTKGIISNVDESFPTINWEEEKLNEALAARKRLLEEELKDRGDQFHGTWEDVYRSVKKADRIRNELHERNDKELERTGQPLCIYEPYIGEGSWPFLHHKSLYRGIGLSAKGRRPGGDDIDASSSLPLLSTGYYRDALGEYVAFFALANRVDRIHKNAWIGFQSWRVVSMKASLTKKAESMLVQAIETRNHGDALYFWVRMDEDPRNPSRVPFWSFCDSINAGNCRYAFKESLRWMYGMSPDWDSLPPMPADGDSWSVMHSWALPTKSFLEFVMFARMFVDALDAGMYDEHHRSGRCYLSFTKDRHCYSKVLELLVNVWAYHSARRIIYINPETGAMSEQHAFKHRRSKMWIKWFSPSTLKAMDEDRAEEWDTEHPKRRWLWPSTGEVFWQGMLEKERIMRQHQRERRKQKSKDKIKRIRSRARQKTLGKYIKPPPEAENEDSIHGGGGGMNSTTNSL